MTAMIFIAGPLTDDPAVGLRRALDVHAAILDEGLAAFCPHLHHYADVVHPRTHDEWVNLGLEFVRRSDHVYRIEGESPGADAQVDYAIEQSIPVWLPAHGGLDEFLAALR